MAASSSQTQHALESLADASMERSRSQKRKPGTQIPSSGRSRSDSLKKAKVGMTVQQEIDINRQVLAKCGMTADRMAKMEEGLGPNELLNKQRNCLKRYTEMEQLKESARSALSK